ncbi:MAG: HNH endonuclease [Rhodobacteraceae bacterium]|nr:HNH endonuclease [Paracoccaceae bacterium]
MDFQADFVQNQGGPGRFSALVLNADYRPLSYFPLSLWSWQDAIRATFLDRVGVVEEYDSIARSPSVEFKRPSVVVLKRYIKPIRRAAFTRFNLFLRDEFTCQYCGRNSELTFDHVIPKSRGGLTEWTNVVAACTHCNLKKGSALPDECGISLRRIPMQPTSEELLNVGRKFPPNHLHESWLDFLYWDVELKT